MTTRSAGAQIRVCRRGRRWHAARLRGLLHIPQPFRQCRLRGGADHQGAAQWRFNALAVAAMLWHGHDARRAWHDARRGMRQGLTMLATRRRGHIARGLRSVSVPSSAGALSAMVMGRLPLPFSR